ncbi:hypothetical protein ES705_37697 [subsurface metagenome]
MILSSEWGLSIKFFFDFKTGFTKNEDINY